MSRKRRKGHGEPACEGSVPWRDAGSGRSPATGPPEPAPNGPPSARAAEFERDPVIEAYKRHVDRTLLRQNLRRSVTERVANLIALQRLAAEARRAGRTRKRDR